MDNDNAKTKKSSSANVYTNRVLKEVSSTKKFSFGLVAVVCAVLSLSVLVWMGASATGAVSQPNHPHVFFSENLCGPGQIPVLTDETRYGSGKMVIAGCVDEDTAISTTAPDFPPIKQRWKKFPIRAGYPR